MTAEIKNNLVVDGQKINGKKLHSLMTRLIDTESKLAKAKADKGAALKSIEDAGFEKKVAVAALRRYGKKQHELDLFEDKVHGYEEAIGWRDPELDVEAAADADRDGADRASRLLRDDFDVEGGGEEAQEPEEPGNVASADEYRKRFMAGDAA